MVFLDMPIALAISSIVTFLKPRLKNNSSDFDIIFAFIKRTANITQET
jgi:hypothetical protein